MRHMQADEGQLERQYDWSTISPSVAVLDAIARFEGTNTARMADRLKPTLGQTIDSDAVDALLTSSASVSLSFTFADYAIQIAGDTVAIGRRESAAN